MERLSRSQVTLALCVAPAAALVAGCSPDPCGNGPGVAPVALDVSGASNTPCTLTVTDGNQTLTYDIPAPVPLVADTSLDARPPPTQCSLMGDAGVAFDGGARSSTQICFAGDDALAKLAHAGGGDGCPLTVTLACAGLTLYDQAKAYFCSEMC